MPSHQCKGICKTGLQCRNMIKSGAYCNKHGSTQKGGNRKRGSNYCSTSYSPTGSNYCPCGK